MGRGEIRCTDAGNEANMSTTQPLTLVQVPYGMPRYLAAKEAVVRAIGAGRFRPGDHLPRTKVLSGQGLP